MTTIKTDKLGRTTSHEDEDSGKTTYEHTAFDEIALQLDAASRQTDFHYDNFGRLLRTESPDGAIDFDYD